MKMGILRTTARLSNRTIELTNSRQRHPRIPRQSPLGVTSHVPNSMRMSAIMNDGASGVRNSTNANALPMNGFTA